MPLDGYHLKGCPLRHPYVFWVARVSHISQERCAAITEPITTTSHTCMAPGGAQMPPVEILDYLVAQAVNALHALYEAYRVSQGYL